MNLTAHTEYTLNAMRAFHLAQIYRGREPGTQLVIRLLIAAALNLLLMFEMLLFRSASLLPVLVAFELCVALYLYMHYAAPHVLFHAMMKESGGGMRTQFVFGDTALSSTSQKRNGYCDAETLPYTAIFQVRETNDYFFIYIRKNTAYVVDKSTLSPGGAEQIAAMLYPILTKRYQRCSY